MRPTWKLRRARRERRCSGATEDSQGWPKCRGHGRIVAREEYHACVGSVTLGGIWYTGSCGVCGECMDYLKAHYVDVGGTE